MEPKDKPVIYRSSQKRPSRSIATENRGVKYLNTLCFPSIYALDTHAGFEMVS